MTRTILSAALLAALLLASPALAQGIFVSSAPDVAQPARPLTGIRAQIARELPRYGYDSAEAAGLSASQAAHIIFLIHSGRSEGDIRGQIGSTLRPGLLQRGLNRVIR